MNNEEPLEEIECICGRSGDGLCHCCECSHEQPTIYEEFDEEEYINEQNDLE